MKKFMAGLILLTVMVTPVFAEDVNWQERALKAEAVVEIQAKQIEQLKALQEVTESLVPKPAQNEYAKFLKEQRLEKRKAEVEAKKAEK